ncbi:hypothetical protein [Pseudomonas brassicacearum]|uniref:Uncharacterized protein n=1 Tax=Pseudomonas brassicacearum TaxID=930166 RepID=A0A423H1W6_9PSED|nr:hypothetical protein [Pseudomonas brassicacearum]RON06230.1 hypothetical protein BK658_00115 [Pseudomonas brassicacearum]
MRINSAVRLALFAATLLALPVGANELKPPSRALPNAEYAAALVATYGKRVHFADDESYLRTVAFKIDCRAQDGRVLPLGTLLLARVADSSQDAVWLESYVVLRGDELRVYDYLVRKDGSATQPTLRFEANRWGEFRAHGVRVEAVLNSCFGSYGPIWRAR